MTTIDPRTSDENVTNTRNDYYDLISVLYHALESAKTYACYVQDAASCGDQELAQFFEQCQQHEREHAERAKQLLAARAAQHTPGDNPTSQPPANRQPTTDEQRKDESLSDSTMWPSGNPTSEAPANWQPTTDEPRKDESLSDPTVWPSRSFDE